MSLNLVKTFSKIRGLSPAFKATGLNMRRMATGKLQAVFPVQDGEEKAHFQLKTGEQFTGVSFGANTACIGEAVFTTSLVGYPESMTDPSYKGQILVFTQPLVGNYGVPKRTRDDFGLLKHFESEKIQCAGVVVSDIAKKYSHWNAVESLSEWCQRSGVPGISGVDTRAVVHLLRGQGSTLGAINIGQDVMDIQAEVQWRDPTSMNLVEQVSIKTPRVYNPGGKINVALIDCGAKNNIVRLLCKRGARVTVLPWDYDFVAHLDKFDGLFISNGPGSPVHCVETVQHLRQAIKLYQRPIFGICMGNQVLGMAAGFEVYKLPFGNRGHNQPVIDTETGRCVITSQNHGYALSDKNVPEDWQVSFVNANDGSVEGIKHKYLPYYSVQFHPEAMGGPLDTEYMVRDFVDNVVEYRDVAWRKREAEMFDRDLGKEQSQKLQMALQ
ncbi:Carbamoyl-phosphate synthase arginine-specific small chain [Zancudomyces culisetae]|uniref:Carbamoyl phosphate synthase arginine-specific small chain n=1 Tax=Zancudomyces culisetae TaxID=1213189 RepID=A0A1R1PHL4_ZANCU|nr:Carbamoyl-phosphate synthase arginine-specific small chain [Zancudomyces culisetae]|eukprot:OMH80466.1 Carbamoyl-phosphate synthase arginine-specific small chain [Zancudomyces culisetae]